ncbi:FMN-binding protein [Pseudomonadota bacterium]
MKRWFTLGLLLLSTTSLLAKGVHQTPEAFIQESFQGKPPAAKVIWLNRPLKKNMANILGHSYRGLRVRYWGKGNRTAWVLNEVGKEKPITIGVIVRAGQLEQVTILTFRESRGGEVRYPSFTDQFINAKLTNKHDLDKSIDGISGATLSVQAVKKTAKLALFLHQQTPFSDDNTQ